MLNAGVILREPGGKLLFLCRSADSDNPGTWCWPGGTGEEGETADQTAMRELREETGYTPVFTDPAPAIDDRDGFVTLIMDVDREFEPTLNDEHTDWQWATAAAPPSPLHPGVAATLKERELPERPITAQDKMAFDRSVRTVDKDGRLHVALTNISKANVCPYYGREIPNGKALGLEPNTIYRLLRDPEELAKGAATFNNLPLQIVHKHQTASEPLKDLIVGSTGTDAVFEAPFLRNSLVVWDEEAIAGIETEDQRELSSAYHYVADMTPGEFEGERYDGVMRDIVGNHVCLVEEGRAGSDVIVEDSALKPLTVDEVLKLAMDGEFNEGDHPRGEGGKFGSGGSGKSAGKPDGGKSKAAQMFEQHGFHTDAPVTTPDGPGRVMAEGSDHIIVKTDKGVETYSKSDVKFDDRPAEKTSWRPEVEGNREMAANYQRLATGLRAEAKNYRGYDREAKLSLARRYMQEARKHETLAKKNDKTTAQDSTEGLNMIKTSALKSRKALLVQGALAAYLGPRLAADANIDLGQALKGVTRGNFAKKRAGIATAVERIATPKLAQDAEIGDLVELLDGLQEVNDGTPDQDDLTIDADLVDGAAAPPDPENTNTPAEDDDDPSADMLAKLKAAGFDDETLAKISAALAPAPAADDLPPNAAPPPAAKEKEEEKPPTQAAMDAAIKKVRKDTIAQLHSIREAENFARPFLGELDLGMDSAESIYKMVLENADIALDGIDPSAYKAMAQMLPKPGARSETKILANDAAAVKSFSERYPTANRIKHA